ncbi:SemiSWEET family sugar transporter [Pluralibacter sp.]|uniref:SemiSWEET family sugar transporter n=1 Tax=Pluralibacter sp. TaxID=1920032 RepID=UPI0025FE6253|nr:SemiSWEET transporter [Pluralibacter sp.]
MFDYAWLGGVAACCTTGSFALQVVHILRTRDTRAISLSMYLVFVFGVLCWLLYGMASGDVPLMVANGITLILASTVLGLKIVDALRSKKHPLLT